jgi:hypothetical protein
MIIILLLLFLMSSLAVGGYFIYQEIQKQQKTDDMLAKTTEIAKTPGLHLFPECEYNGTALRATENLPVSADDKIMLQDDLGFRSFVLTDGYKLDTYYTTDHTGTNITYNGPQEIRCKSKRPIKSVRLYKA